MTSTQAKEKVLISQADNYAGNFGEVLRSSAIFWMKRDDKINSTLSFSNYWKFKNSTDVSVVLNVREPSGRLIRREPVSFERSEVFNYSPPDNFEGSVEVEVFSIRNMRIPYAAIMAIYETKESISMVHSYARSYSQHELEDGRTICIGEESCWTLRDTDDLTSFCVIHNGSLRKASQAVTLRVRNSLGKEQSVDFELPALAPFETVVVEPKSRFRNLVDWLGGEPGNARISFELGGGFTRMLCGIKNRDGTQLQVTHSNFDYSTHDTDKITEGIVKAHMRTPNAPAGFNQEIVVYPDTNKGNYVARIGNEESHFSTGEIHRKTFGDGKEKYIEFSRKDGILPARIVTAMRLESGNGVIPAECSLGVVHHNRPRKHFSWMVVSEKFDSQVCWVDFKEVYGGCPPDAEFAFKLYTAGGKQPLARNFKYSELPGDDLVGLADLFGASTGLGDDYGYLSVWCSYGGLMFFSTLRKNRAITIEHSF